MPNPKDTLFAVERRLRDRMHMECIKYIKQELAEKGALQAAHREAQKRKRRKD